MGFVYYAVFDNGFVFFCLIFLFLVQKKTSATKVKKEESASVEVKQ